MVNTVKSEENVVQIGQKYLQFDINHDNKNDIIMRDQNNIYIKYANQENKYGNTNFSSNYYVYELNDPDDLRNDEKTEPNYDGYVDIGNIALKLADENREVKNFKMQGQDFESISF